MGEKIMEENTVGSALTQQQISHYSPETNHCYVRLEVSTADLTTPQDKFTRDQYLYDGQTKEMLAAASWHGGKKWASILSDTLNKYVHDPAAPTYDETDGLINKFMAEERKP